MELLRLVADETVLTEFVAGLSTLTLLGLIVICLAALSWGADKMIDGVVSLARRTGLPRIVIGATVVSLGTTTPEAVVSVMAAWMGNPGLALGNGVGSIIADTGLVFGVTCLLATVPMNRYILNRTGWVQVGAATLLVVIAVAALGLADSDPMLGRPVGFFLLVLLGCYLFATYRWARQGGEVAMEGENEYDSDPPSLPVCWLMLVGGLLLVVAAARILVPCAAEIAGRLGVPDDVIAATMVALGTSLPELMTAITAVRKGHPEIMVGNVVGADVLNCLFVIGAAAAAKPLAVPQNFYLFHFPTMLLILYSFRVFIYLQRRHGYFRKYQGAWLVAIYALYVILQYGLNIGAHQG